MYNFEKITIDELSKTDLLAIIEALEFTYKQTNINKFNSLKESIVSNMCSLSKVHSKEELVELLTK